MAKPVSDNHEEDVPSVSIALVEELNAQKWYHGNISREESQQILLDSDLELGTFIVRRSENAKHPFSLSVLDENNEGIIIVRHYRVFHNDKTFWILSSKKFDSLLILVKHYQSNAELCCLLRESEKTGNQLVDLWEIDRSTLSFGRKLGEGYFAEVHMGTWKKTTRIAIKRLKHHRMSSEAFLEEADIMKRFQHDHIVPLYGVVSSKPINIVMEYLCHGNLIHFLRAVGKHLLSGDHIFIAKQIASGMSYISQQNFVHRDLRAANVLVGDNMLCKISDFGLARSLMDGIYTAHAGVFPVRWASPEVLRYRSYSVKSDIWSFGIVLMEIVTKGGSPYRGLRSKEIKYEVLKGYRIPKPKEYVCTDNLYKIMLHCWEEDPRRRPYFEDLEKLFATEEEYYQSMYVEGNLADLLQAQKEKELQ